MIHDSMRWRLVAAAMAATAAAWTGCAQTPKPPPRSEPPAEFFQPPGPQTERPEQNTFHPGYRINYGDQLEIIYQVRTDLQPDEYRLQIEDRINIQFPFQPELNQTQTIRSDGKLNLLLLDEPVLAYGKTVRDFTAELRALYAKQLTRPVLTAVVEEADAKIEELKRAITTSPRGQSRLVPVKPDGRITLPLIGDIMAFGRTTIELREDLNEAYRKTGVEGVDVSANLLVLAPVRVYVMGEVNRPGLTSVNYDTTLTQAVGQAGGWLRGRADAAHVLLIRRRGMAAPKGAVVDVGYLTEGLADRVAAAPPPAPFDQHRFDPFIQDGDIIYVPSTRLAKNADWINIVFTEGLYKLIPFSTSVSFTDDVDWLGPNP